MKQIIILMVLGVALVAGVVYLNKKAGESDSLGRVAAPVADTTVSYTTYKMADLGLTFMYLSGDTGYTLYERESAEGTDAPIATLMLVHANERSMMENPPAYSEGPINISVTVYQNDQKQFPYQWAQEHTSYSNIQMVVGETHEVVVGGANAIRYTVDGLYQIDTVVVAHGEKMYVFTSSYHDLTSPTYRDFDSILDSVQFIPEPGQG